jgi:small-conductance mechanosensitive channel
VDIRKGILAGATLVVASMGTASAQAVYGNDGPLGMMVNETTKRFEGTLANIPAVLAHLKSLPRLFDVADVGLLLSIVLAGLFAELFTRMVLQRARLSVFERHIGESPVRAFFHAIALDALALLALWVVARLVVRAIGPTPQLLALTAHDVLIMLLYWRGFNFVFRAWLRPNTPEGRIAPVDDRAAKSLLIGLNLLILLPMIGRHLLVFLENTGASRQVIATAVLLYVPVIGIGLMLVVWHWRHEMATWLGAMVRDTDIIHDLKVRAAHKWWISGLLFYALAGTAAVYAALTDRESATRGLSTVESMLILMLLFETLVHHKTRSLSMEIPTLGEVVAACLKLAIRLVIVIVIVNAVAVSTLGLMSPEAWEVRDSAMKTAALSAFGAYSVWRLLKFRMDKYIADNPLPVAGFGGGVEGDEEAPSTASRLRTIMPVLRITAGITILILGGLLVLSELGVNITPLIAGASVLGLAVSFGSQSLVRDIVSGMFFLAEDSFRVGEYIDSSKVKGTVEGFSVRSLRLRHQNGPLHIVPFGQIGHITNFSRDWTTVKFNLAFAIDTDVELLRRTVKKIGLEMMAEPAYAKELLQPLKMQGIVDIKDGALVVRFKFTAKPQNPSLVQRISIRRMYEAFPDKGIAFARPPGYAMFAGQAASFPQATPPEPSTAQTAEPSTAQAAAVAAQ